jgi:hypothetical protein
VLVLMFVSCWEWWDFSGGIGIDDEIGDIVGAARGFHVHIVAVAVAGVDEYISDAVDVVFVFVVVVSYGC